MFSVFRTDPKAGFDKLVGNESKVQKRFVVVVF